MSSEDAKTVVVLTTSEFQTAAAVEELEQRLSRGGASPFQKAPFPFRLSEGMAQGDTRAQCPPGKGLALVGHADNRTDSALRIWGGCAE